MIPSTNAIVDPLAVMVKLTNAFVADVAVATGRGVCRLAIWT